MHLFIFGESGAGKSYVGALCVAELGFELYDGDRDLTLTMGEAISAQRLFTPAMRAEFAEVLARNVRSARDELLLRSAPARGLAVCQGLFKERERRWLSAQFPAARWLWVRTPPGLLRERLAQRAGHEASAAYAALVNAGFEPPELAHDVLDNDGDRARVVRQLRVLL